MGKKSGSTVSLLRNIFKRVLFFLAGAVLLCLCSMLQKMLVGSPGMALVFNPKAYMIPVLYGGITGLLIGEWNLKLRRDAVRIKEREDQLRTLIDAIPDFVIFKDSEGRWLELNRAGEAMFGFKNAATYGKTDLDLAQSYPDLSDLLHWCQSMDDLTWKGGGVYRCMVDPFPSKGQEKCFDVMKVPIYWPDGSSKGLVTIGRDITQIKKSKEMLEAAYDTTLAGWAKAVELRDQSTQDHTERVVELSEKLGQLVGLSEEKMIDLRRGAMLHDIGKISTPDSILTKPGPLTDEEIEIMRRHPVVAYQMLAQIAFLKRALDVPYCHHERWDGRGYPQGLQGEDIPINARIFALADVWDALTNDRPYRSAISKEKAMNYIREKSGILFDPEIAPLFLKLFDYGEAAASDRIE